MLFCVCFESKNSELTDLDGNIRLLYRVNIHSRNEEEILNIAYLSSSFIYEITEQEFQHGTEKGRVRHPDMIKLR